MKTCTYHGRRFADALILLLLILVSLVPLGTVSLAYVPPEEGPSLFHGSISMSSWHIETVFARVGSFVHLAGALGVWMAWRKHPRRSRLLLIYALLQVSYSAWLLAFLYGYVVSAAVVCVPLVLCVVTIAALRRISLRCADLLLPSLGLTVYGAIVNGLYFYWCIPSIHGVPF